MIESASRFEGKEKSLAARMGPRVLDCVGTIFFVIKCAHEIRLTCTCKYIIHTTFHHTPYQVLNHVLLWEVLVAAVLSVSSSLSWLLLLRLCPLIFLSVPPRAASLQTPRTCPPFGPCCRIKIMDVFVQFSCRVDLGLHHRRGRGPERVCAPLTR